MHLGAFSVSLSVKDLATSRALYEKLGFREARGDPAQHWLILRNGGPANLTMTDPDGNVILIDQHVPRGQ